MKRVIGCALVVSVLGFAVVQYGRAADEKKVAAAKVFDFEDAAVDKLPPGFASSIAGSGKEGVWVVKEDPKAAGGKKVLAQTDADPTDARFPACVVEGVKAKDVDVSVRFKTVSGKVDQAAGLIVRYRDKGNYYVARANAEEGNVRIYKFENGKRSRQFAGANLDVTSGEWHTLKLGVKGNHFTVSLDGKVLFEADDATFADAGQVGVWTKADSVTYFDDLTIESKD